MIPLYAVVDYQYEKGPLSIRGMTVRECCRSQPMRSVAAECF